MKKTVEERSMSAKRIKNWLRYTIGVPAVVLVLVFIIMFICDPYFHFHGPLKGLSYRITEERYVNNGIVKNFNYDAVITGSSMNQNFKTTTMDSLFGTNAVKVPFSGAGFQEVSDNLRVALESGNEIKYVLWGLDYNGLNRDYDWQGYENFPEYLYDNNPWNDLSYVFNKSILLEGLFNNLVHTVTGQPTTTFDEYSSWEVGSGWEVINRTYRRSKEILPMEEITEKEINRVTDNIRNNIVELVKDYPDTTFLLFYTPYSALYWESIYRDGWLFKQIEMEKIATQMLLECENVRLFNFSKETEITGDVLCYRDKEHYIASVNELILQWILEGRGLVTGENYEDTLAWEREYYTVYDYDRLYQGYEQYKIPWEE
ncbi:MAG: hypothetical protein IKW28_10780 [Lachnospiraceae bacterium]|nr:hypothetical protein [Lachnospiraceae bacterium]